MVLIFLISVAALTSILYCIGLFQYFPNILIWTTNLTLAIADLGLNCTILIVFAYKMKLSEMLIWYYNYWKSSVYVYCNDTSSFNDSCNRKHHKHNNKIIYLLLVPWLVLQINYDKYIYICKCCHVCTKILYEIFHHQFAKYRCFDARPVINCGDLCHGCVNTVLFNSCH
eukprot:148435_1